MDVLGTGIIWCLVVFLKDVFAHKDEWEKDTNSWISGLIGGFTNFIDTLGIGSFAPTTALIRVFKQVKDRVIPATLNVSCTLPVVAEGFIFMTVIKVESLTLLISGFKKAEKN